MSKVTSKLQVTLPKALARQYRIEPGADIEWQAAGDAIRVVVLGKGKSAAKSPSPRQRLRWFDQATERQRIRQAGSSSVVNEPSRGWTREQLYERGRSG